MSLSDKLEIVNLSDTGRRRPHNEDSTLSDLEQGLVVLADGMGGYKAGEVASAIAVTSPRIGSRRPPVRVITSVPDSIEPLPQG